MHRRILLLCLDAKIHMRRRSPRPPPARAQATRHPSSILHLITLTASNIPSVTDRALPTFVRLMRDNISCGVAGAGAGVTGQSRKSARAVSRRRTPRPPTPL
ncbi:hypothetical protein EVAR_65402_1 [Eumeta japonica]|uniref:Uncharacterized protein n=1 Tax=Eumeta variegata TaxID=151549 RepID=A0A4C1ZMN2_EUMVA|nr:hypothetical protein EVAR_65402_1 [Eumeta japonica]